MANDGFNGTTLVIAGSTVMTPLLDVNFNETAAAVLVSGSTDATKLYVAGQPDETCTFTVAGVSALAIGETTGALTVTWFDGATDTFTTASVTDNAASGAVDGTIQTAITVRRAS